MNPAVEALEPSVIRTLNARKRPSSIDLGLGEPTLRPDPALFERATARVAAEGCRYSPAPGLQDLREAIARHYAYPGMDRAENVCVTTGSQEAVYVALRCVLDPARDELLIVSPTFTIYGKIAEVEGIPFRTVEINPRGEDPFDPEAILAAIGPKTRLIAICSPCNPTGTVMSRGSARRLAEGLLARGGEPIVVMHDEIYRELVYTDDVAEIARVYSHTIAINSLSKSNALTGLRIGWAIAPTAIIAQMVKLHGLATSCPNTFSQYVASEVFAANALAVQRPWYAAQRTAALAALDEIGLDYIVPEGAFYACVRVDGTDTRSFAFELIEKRDVVAIPGDLFSPLLAGWLRASFVAPPPQLREGFARIASFSHELGSVLCGRSQ